MRILLCEGSYYPPLNPYFERALQKTCGEMGHSYRFLDEARYLKRNLSVVDRVTRRLLGPSFVMKTRRRRCNEALLFTAAQFEPALILVVNGKWIEPATLVEIKRRFAPVLINWATDDPFNKSVTTPWFRESIGLYDVFATPKQTAMADYRAAGCSKVIYAPFIYKPEIHFPEQPAGAEEAEKFKCDVAFVGSADSARIRFLQQLCPSLSDLKVHLYGTGWNRVRALSKFARGVAEGRALRLAASQASIMLNFIRHSNRDDHSERSLQLAACGAFLLSERTSTQLSILSEDREAAFFDTAEEAAAKIRHYLARPGRRSAVAAAGRGRMLSGHYDAGSRLSQLLAAAADVRVQGAGVRKRR